MCVCGVGGGLHTLGKFLMTELHPYPGNLFDGCLFPCYFINSAHIETPQVIHISPAPGTVSTSVRNVLIYGFYRIVPKE